MSDGTIIRDGEELGAVDLEPYDFEYDGDNRVVRDILEMAHAATAYDTAGPDGDGGLASERAEPLDANLMKRRLEKEFAITDHDIRFGDGGANEKAADRVVGALSRLKEKGLDITGDVVDAVTEAALEDKAASGRRYVDDPSEAPESAELQEGPEGGLYYETGGSTGSGDPDGEPPAAERESGPDVSSEAERAVDVRTEELEGGGVNINHFEVDPDARGEGHGTEMMEAMLDDLAAQGKEYVAVNMGTGGGEPDAVADWLEGFGFEVMEAEPGHVDGILEMDEYEPGDDEHDFKTGDHPTEWERPEPDQLGEYVEEVQESGWWSEGKEKFEDAFFGDDNTRERHTTGDGEWDESRVEDVHEPAVEEMLNEDAETAEGEQPVGVILMGPPGAGKGWWEENYADDFDRDFTRINSDDAKEHIPEYEGSNAAEVHEESSHIAKKGLAPEAIEQGHNIIFDNVSSSSTEELKQAMEDAGHDMRAVFVDVPSEKSAHNVVSRYEDEGRFTPLDYTVGARDDSFSVFADVAADMDSEKVSYYNNDVEWGEPPEGVVVGEETFKLWHKLAANGRL